MTAAEQFAAAFQRLIDEAFERASGAKRTADRALRTQEAAEFLGFDRTYVVRLAKKGEIASTGEGRQRRFLLGDLEAYRRRHRNGGRKVQDFSTFGGTAAAGGAH